MENKAFALLKEGRKLIDPIMEANGFHWVPGPAGKSSGGNFDSGEYVKNDRRLELHFRHFLGLIIYRIGSNSLTHESTCGMLLVQEKTNIPDFPPTL